MLYCHTVANAIVRLDESMKTIPIMVNGELADKAAPVPRRCGTYIWICRVLKFKKSWVWRPAQRTDFSRLLDISLFAALANC
jgi:hypothetical protein